MCNGHAVPAYNQGDHVRVELLSGNAGATVSVWIRVEHCDDQHAIVFGTIDGEIPQGIGNALRRGATLAASYRQVRECRAPS